MSAPAVKNFDDWLNKKIVDWSRITAMSRRDPEYFSALEDAHRDMLFALMTMNADRVKMIKSVKEEIEKLQRINEFEAGCG